jgi:hypothetical protein
MLPRVTEVELEQEAVAFSPPPTDLRPGGVEDAGILERRYLLVMNLLSSGDF